MQKICLPIFLRIKFHAQQIIILWNLLLKDQYESERTNKSLIIARLLSFNLILLVLELIIDSLAGYLNVAIIEQPIPSRVAQWIPIYGILLAPILEELLFRLPILFSKRNILIASFALELIVLNAAWCGNINFLSQSLLAIALVVQILLLLSHFKRGLFSNEAISRFKILWRKNQRAVILTSAIIFTLLHKPYFMLEGNNKYFLPVLLTPHFIFSLSASYARLSWGIGYSMVIHFLHNIITVFVISFFLK